MNDEQLKQLLCDADAAMPPPANSDHLAKQVLRRAHRRAQIRGALGIGAVLLLAGIMTWAALRPDVRPNLAQRQEEILPRHQPSAGDEAKVQLAQLEMDAELHQSIATALLQASLRQERAAKSTRSFVRAANLEASFAETRDETAHVMVVQADRLLNRPEGRSEAIATYRRVTELFPATSGASAARQRLRELRA
ncbi:MAG TPA: hypothetical protein VFW23_01675 [Tepidisphaeraceae bacterium]|nr:hypothetical protein [Tepidisphaeraceae bacterium]